MVPLLREGSEMDREVAKRTGEKIGTIRARGFGPLVESGMNGEGRRSAIEEAPLGQLLLAMRMRRGRT